jgi:hypothetical protein
VDIVKGFVELELAENEGSFHRGRVTEKVAGGVEAADKFGRLGTKESSTGF